MAETNAVTLSLITTVTQVLDATATPGATTPRVTHNGFNTSTTLNATSTPAVTKSATFTQALTAGAATVDLTTLTGTNGAVVTGAGLRVQVLKIRSKSANTAAVTVASGASDGYDGYGSAFSVDIPAGGTVVLYAPECGTDISATNKTLDLASSDTDAILEFQIAMG